jgi:hypothetical protein
MKEKRPAGRFFIGVVVAVHAIHSHSGKAFFRTGQAKSFLNIRITARDSDQLSV